ncbi:MAG: DinB family protein [candidate division Zixibacteria bacterium]
MIDSINWIDRRFNFDFPVGVFPWIIERLRGTPARVEELVRGLTPVILTKQSDGKWSIQENVGHLIKVEELHDGRIDDFLAGKEILRPADMENKRTTAADFNSRDIEMVLESIRKVRTNLVKRLEGMDDDLIGHPSRHPRLDIPMRPVDMAYFAAEHDDYHLATIARLARGLR